MQNYNSQSGNILFIILIAVALFAALTYAISQTSRTSEVRMSKQTAQTASSQITQYASSIHAGMERMKVTGNCKPIQVNFDYPSCTSAECSNFGNPNSPTDNHCNVFDARGASILPHDKIDTAWLDPAFSAAPYYGYWVAPRLRAITAISTNAGGDIIYVLPYLKKEICEEINSGLGIREMVDAPGLIDNRAFPDTATDMTVHATVTATTPSGGTFGQESFCAYTNSLAAPATYFYAYVQVMWPS